MRNIRLRTKFLLSLLAISAGLTTATLSIVRYSVQERVRDGIREDLRTSVSTYQTFDRQREDSLARTSALLANLPNVRALMTTRDPVTVQDASADVWRQSGSDVLILGGPSGEPLGVQTHQSEFDRKTAGELLRHSLEKGESKDWWFEGGRLYEVWIQPIYFGRESRHAVLGYMAVADVIDERAARDFSNIASSEVAFSRGDQVAASTLPPDQLAELPRILRDPSREREAAPQELPLGHERYLAATLNLSAGSKPEVSLTVLKSFDKATAFVAELNRVLLGLGAVTILAGSALVFFISDTFTRPLSNLVAGVRALEAGDFNYPLESSGGDEVAQVTGAFDRMRRNLQRTLEEQKQLEQRLRQAHKMEAVGRLAGGVAHDFNNLLTIIRGHSDLLFERVGASGPMRNNVEQIQKAAGRAVSMTRQLLAFSRMQVLQPRVLDLNAVVADMGKMLPRLIGEHIEYTFIPGANLSPVTADPGQIEQVILNLVVNSRDAMPQGGKITVCTDNVTLSEAEAAKRPPMSAGQFVLLSVADTGHGMDEETKTHIFEPFFTTKEIGKGTGLGLATVYGVVKQSGGFIWVESAPGQGARFEIYLPQTRGKVADTEAEKKPTLKLRGSETVLVVEDESGVRELACEFLKVSGYAVLEAKDGIEALEIASRHSGTIHLLLSDIVMPRMSGHELASRIKTVRPEIKILFMSGYAEYASGDSPGPLSPQPAVLQKPFSVSSLVEKVRETLTVKSVENVDA